MGKDKASKLLDLEWENRVLCSDESCIGVIGSDGRCKECGLRYEGDWPSPDFDPAELESSDPTSCDTTDESIETDEDEGRDEISDEQWSRRKLCSDESCIGVIGPDGRCKECGLAGKP